MVPFLQHVLSSNVMALDLNQAQYAIIPNENGGAVDDAYLYRFEEDRYLLVVNAANRARRPRRTRYRPRSRWVRQCSRSWPPGRCVPRIGGCSGRSSPAR